MLVKFCRGESGMRFSILAKIGLLFTVVLVGAMVAVLWNTNRVFYNDKQAFVVEINSKLSQGVSQLMEEKVGSLISKLAIFASNYQSLSEQQKKQAGVNSVLFSQYEDFYGIMSVDPGSRKVAWQVSNDLSEAKSWPIGFMDSLVQNFALEKATDTGLYFQRLSSPEGLPIFAVSIRAQVEDSNNKNVLKDTVLVGLVNSNLFAGVVNNYKASLNTAFLVDASGFVYAHPNERVLGQALIENQVVKEIQQTAKPAGAGDSYKDEIGDTVAAGYEKIGNTNLYAIITTPREEAFRAADELFKTLLVIGIGVLVAGLALSLIFTRLITKPLKDLKSVAAEIGSGNFEVPVNVKSRDEVGELAGSIGQMAQSLIEREEQLEHSKMALVQSEKMSAFGQLSAGIAHEVKNPLAGILGHTQLAKAKVKNDDMKKHLDIIESETRRTKEIIEGLMKFARAEKLELSPTNMWDVVQAAVDLVEHQLSLAGVKISRSVNRVPCVLANGNQIQQVMLNLMMNAGHAMEDCENKSLHIYLDHIKEEKLVRLRIEDTGHGMPEEVKNKIFEPFFTTKPAGKGTGLGLSVSVGIVRDHKANIYVESEIDVGTTFFIDFPEAEEAELPESEYMPKFGDDSAEAQVPAAKSEPAAEQEEPLMAKQINESQDTEALDDDLTEEIPREKVVVEEPVSEAVVEENLADEDEDEEDDFQFAAPDTNLGSSPVEEKSDEGGVSALDAIAGFSDEDDEPSLEDKTMIEEVPDMPSVDSKQGDETEVAKAEEEKVDKPASSFQVKIRKPKLKG